MTLATWQFKHKEDGLVSNCLKVVVEKKEADEAEKTAGKNATAEEGPKVISWKADRE